MCGTKFLNPKPKHTSPHSECATALRTRKWVQGFESSVQKMKTAVKTVMADVATGAADSVSPQTAAILAFVGTGVDAPATKGDIVEILMRLKHMTVVQNSMQANMNKLEGKLSDLLDTNLTGSADDLDFINCLPALGVRPLPRPLPQLQDPRPRAERPLCTHLSIPTHVRVIMHEHSSRV